MVNIIDITCLQRALHLWLLSGRICTLLIYILMLLEAICIFTYLSVFINFLIVNILIVYTLHMFNIRS